MDQEAEKSTDELLADRFNLAYVGTIVNHSKGSGRHHQDSGHTADPQVVVVVRTQAVGASVRVAGGHQQHPHGP